jgi:hypothetical protein
MFSCLHLFDVWQESIKTSWLQENMGLCDSKLNIDDISEDLTKAVERYGVYTAKAQVEITRRVLVELLSGKDKPTPERGTPTGPPKLVRQNAVADLSPA